MEIAEIVGAIQELKSIALEPQAPNSPPPSPELNLIVIRLERMLNDISSEEPDIAKLFRGVERIDKLKVQLANRVVAGWAKHDFDTMGSQDYIVKVGKVVSELSNEVIRIAEKRTQFLRENVIGRSEQPSASGPTDAIGAAEAVHAIDSSESQAPYNALLEESVDKKPSQIDHDPMTIPSREEIDAKLETIEARMDGRVASIQASIEGFMGRIEERALRTDERFVRIESSSNETQASIRSLKGTMIVTALSTVIAIVLGVAAFNATVLSNMLASFESGKNTASAQAEVRRQAEETAAIIRELQKKLDQQQGQQKSDPQRSSPTAPTPTH